MTIEGKLRVPKLTDRLRGVAGDMLDVGGKSALVFLALEKETFGHLADIQKLLPVIAPVIDFFALRKPLIRMPSLMDGKVHPILEEHAILNLRQQFEKTKSVLVGINPVLTSIIINSPWPNWIKGVSLTALAGANVFVFLGLRSRGRMEVTSAAFEKT